jgi:hypothetical protein
MTDETIDPTTDSSIPVLFVPADPDIPIRILTLPNPEAGFDILQQAVGGNFEVQAHDEGDIWLNDEGRLLDLPINVRINHWMLNDSALAREHQVGESLVMYGDVVVTGPPDENGDITAVDQHMVDYFENLNLDADVMKDWDIRSTHVIVIFETPDSGVDLDDFGPGL